MPAFKIPAGRSEVQGHPWKTGEFDIVWSMWVSASKNKMVVLVRVIIIKMYKHFTFTHVYNDLST